MRIFRRPRSVPCVLTRQRRLTRGVSDTVYPQGLRTDCIVYAVPVFDARGFFDGISDPEAFHLDLFENQCPRWKGEEIPPYAFCAVIHSISRWKDNGLWRLSFGLYAVVVLFADEEDEDADGAE